MKKIYEEIYEEIHEENIVYLQCNIYSHILMALVIDIYYKY